MDAVACEEDEGPTNINNLPPAILHGVFAWLGPRELCAVSCTCILWRRLNRDHVSNSLWKKFYSSKWSVAPPAGNDVCWQSKYGSKMKQGKCWTGKYEHDSLYGHKAGVKALKLLPSHGMLVTGSLDRTVRLWDLKYGMPLSISRAHGGTVRSVALDSQLVVSGSSDNVVRLWHARNSTSGCSAADPAVAAAEACLQDSIAGTAACGAGAAGSLGLSEELLHLMEMDGPADLDSNHIATAAAAGAGSSSISLGFRGGVPFAHGPYSVVTGEADDSLFDLSLPGQALRGHIGPVTSLCLTESCLYSGSWDYTVRCWRRGSWDCISVLKYQDWVWGVVARGGLLLVASGPEVHVHDLPTGKLVRKFQNLHEGSVSCVEGTHSGQMLFSGGADGLLMAHDLRMKESSRVLWHHNAGVHGLALEDPWLVSAASDGTVVMHNYEVALPNNTCKSSSSSGSAFGSSVPSRRTLHAPGSGPLYCVDMADSWLAAGGESPAVRTWDFTKAAEAAARAAAARVARNSAKHTAKQRRAAAAAGRLGENTDSLTRRSGKRAGDNGAGSKKGKGESSNQGHSNHSGGLAASGSAAGAAACCAAAAGSSSAVAAGSAAADGNGNSGNKPTGLLAAAAAAAKAVEAPTPASVGANNVDRYYRMRHARSQQQQHHSSSSQQQHGGAFGGCSSHEYGSSPQWQWTGYGNSPQHWHGIAAQQHHLWHGRYGSSPQQQRWHGYSTSPQQQWTGTSPNNRWHGHGNRSNSHKQIQTQQYRGGNAAPGSSNSNRTAKECSSTAGVPIPVGVHGSSSGSSRQSMSRHSLVGRSAAAETAAPRGRESSTVALSSSPGCNADGAALPHSVGDAGYRVPYSSSYPAAGQPSPWMVGSSPRFEVVLRRGAGAEKQTVTSGDDGSSDAAAAFATDVSAPGSLSKLTVGIN